MLLRARIDESIERINQLAKEVKALKDEIVELRKRELVVPLPGGRLVSKE
jgi:flagellar hook-associated protein FlgK